MILDMFSSVSVLSVILGLAAGAAGYWGSGKLADYMGFHKGKKGLDRILRTVFRAALTALCAVVPAIAIGAVGLPATKELLDKENGETIRERFRSLFMSDDEKALQKEIREYNENRQKRMQECGESWKAAQKDFGVDGIYLHNAVDDIHRQMMDLHELTIAAGKSLEELGLREKYDRMNSLYKDMMELQDMQMYDKYAGKDAKQLVKEMSSRTGASVSKGKDPDRKKIQKTMKRFAVKTALKVGRKALLKM